MKKLITTKVLKKQYIFTLIIIISILFFVGGFSFYKNEEKSLKTEKTNDLEAISKLKINQLTQWLKERTSDAKILSNSPFFANRIIEWVENQENINLKNDILKKFQQYKTAYDYNEIFLCNKNKEILISNNNESILSSETGLKIKETIDSSKITFTDIYYCNIHKEIHFDIITPIYNENRKIIATIVLRIAPEKYVFPLIQSWPTISKTAETFLLRKDGDSILFLNELRFKKNSALSFKLPIINENIPAVRAALGFEGSFEGVDYRGVEVLSVIKKVPKTNWYMVTKIDKDELYSELNFRSFLIFAFVFFLIILVSVGLFWLYHYRQRNIYYQLYHNEKELLEVQKEFQTTLYSIGDAVITSDTTGRIKMMNPIAEQLTGWTEEEAKQKNIEEVFNIVNDKTRKKATNPVELVLKSGNIIGLANHTILISKDGREFPIADSGAPIKNQNNEIIGVVLVFRDQTEEYELQKKFIESETRYKSLHNASFGGIVIHDKGLILDCNQGLSEITGYSYEELIGMNGLLLIAEKNRDLVMNNILSGYEKPYEVIGLHKNGEEYPIRLEARNIPYKGKMVRCTEFRDITVQKSIEEKLKESSELLTTFIKNSPIYTYIKEVTQNESKVIYASDCFLKMIGFTSEEMLGKSMYELFPSEFAKKITDDDWAVISDGKILELTEVLDNKIYTTIKFPIVQNNKRLLAGYTIDITELKEAERQIKESEAFLNRIIEQSPFATWISDAEGTLQRANPALKKFLNLTDEQLVGKYNVLKDDLVERQGLIPLIRTVYENGKTIHFNCRWDGNDIPSMDLKGSNEVFIDATMFPIFNSKGEITNVVLNWLDISEQKKAEEALSLISSRNQAILESVPDIIMEVDNHKKYTWANNTGKAFFGDDVLGKEAAFYFEREQETYNIVSPLFNGSTNDIIYVESWQRRFDGEKRLLAWWCKTLKDKDGNITGALSAAQDITEKNKYQQELKESEERFRTIFENATIGLYRTTPEGKIILANQKIVQLLGFNTFEDLSKIHLDEHGYANPEDRKRFKELTEQTDEVYGFESTWKSRDGKIVFIRESSKVYRNPDGSIKFYEGTVEDITERKKAEEALRESEAFIRAIMDNLPIGVAVNSIDPKVNFVYMNDNFPKIYRTTREQLLEPDLFWESVYEDKEFREKIKKRILDDISSGDLERMYWKDIPITRKGKETTYISSMNTNVPGKSLMISTVWDVSERVNAEQLLQKQNKELETQYEEFYQLSEVLRQTNYDLEIAKQKAEESEEKHRFLFENTIQGVVYHSNTGEIIFANKAAAEILGLTVDQMNGLTSTDPRWKSIREDGSEYPGENHPSSITIKTGKPVYNQVMGIYNPKKEGYTWININSFPKYSSNSNELNHIVVTFEDITERKLSEVKLKHFNDLMQYIISHASSAIAILDKEMKYVYVSERYLKDYNLTEHNLIGKYHYDIFTDLPVQWIEAHKKSLNGEVTGNEEDAYIRPDGSIEWARWECRPWFDIDGSIAGIILYTEFITGRKNAEKALIESYELLFNLTERVPGVVYQYRLWTDGHSAFPYSSQGMYDIYEVTSEEVLEDASLVFTRLHPDDYDFVANAIYESAKNQSFFQLEFRVILPKQGLRWRSSNAKPTLLEDGSTLWYGIIVDITDLKAAQEELQHKNIELEAQYEEYMQLNEVLRQTNYDLEIAKSKAEESDKLKTAFLQNMSHEIRTPLNGILGFSKLLSEQDISIEEITEYTGIINQSGNRLLEIVNNVLDIAKIETGQFVVNNISFSVMSVLKDLYSFFTAMAKGKGINLSYSVPFNFENLFLLTDKAKLTQILSNLINNAIKFTQIGSVVFGYEIVDNQIQFFVKDSGIGIGKEHQSKIFERFAQVDLSITRGFEGAGLGLAICKGLIEILNGKIWLDSEIGKGTIFYFTLPLTQCHINNDSTKLDNYSNFKFNGLKILIAEDDLTSVTILKKPYYII